MCSAPKKIKGYKELMIGIPKRKILVRMGDFFYFYIYILKLAIIDDLQWGRKILNNED